MSGDLGDLNLRWVRYDGVYYAAMLVPPADAPVEMEDGQHFVYFLDGEAGSVVTDADIAPFDLNDVEKVSHPAAVAGVAIARGIMEGSTTTAGADAGAGANDSLEEMAQYMTAAELERDLGEEERGDLLGVLPREDGANSKKKSAKKKQEAKKQEKAEKKHRKAKRHRERDSEDDGDEEKEGQNDDELLLTSGKKGRKGKSHDSASGGSSSSSSSSSEDNRKNGSSESDAEEEDVRAARTKIAKAKNEADHWSGFAEDYGFGGDDEDDDEEVAAAVMGSTPRRGGGRRGGGNLMSMALSALNARSSPVTYYLPQIKHAYLTMRQEAAQIGKLLSAYESAVVRAVEMRLRTVHMEIRLLNDALQKPDLERGEEDKLREALDKLQRDDSVDVEAITRAVVHLRDAPATHAKRRSEINEITVAAAAANIAAAAAESAGEVDGPVPRRHKTNRNVSVFQDPATLITLKNAASQAEQRDMAGEAAQRYREQLLRRQQFIAAHRAAISSAALAGSAEANPRPSSSRYGTAPTHLEMFFQSREAAALASASAMPMASFDQNALSASQGNGTQATPSFNDYGLRFMTNTSGTLTSFPGASQPLNAIGGGASNGFAAGSAAVGAGRPHNVRPTVTDDSLNLFNSANTPLRQSRSHAMIPSFYRFGSFLSTSQDGNDIFRSLTQQQQQQSVGEADADGNRLSADVVQVSPMNLPFDHRAAFAIHPDEDARLDASAMRSSMMSASYNMESQQSLWYDSGSGLNTEHNSVGGAHSQRDSRAHSSLASSVGHGRRRDGGGGGGKSSTATTAKSDWRAGAKRAILEMLTLYYKGLRGRPQVLDLEDFHSVARLLLDRAVRQEAQRQGVSMALKSSHLTEPFTKEVEAAIKKSVESYVVRHYVERQGQDGARGVDNEEDGYYKGESRREGSSERLHDGDVDHGDRTGITAAADDDIEYQA